MPQKFSRELELMEHTIAALKHDSDFAALVSEYERLLTVLGNTNGVDEMVALAFIAMRNTPRARAIL